MLALTNQPDSQKRKANGTAEEEPESKRKTLQSGIKHHNRVAEADEEEMENFRRKRAMDEDPLKGLKEDEILPL